ncbi:MAG: hypothetical protein OXE58_08235 [Acidobacteria bacterium]|nr:hypothetical protein [Acidobacteriota bacterium]
MASARSAGPTLVPDNASTRAASVRTCSRASDSSFGLNDLPHQPMLAHGDHQAVEDLTPDVRD